MSILGTAVLAAADQQPEDVGKSGPLGLLLTVLLLVAVALLVRSMTTHLKRVPRSFDPADAPPDIPDTPAELLDDRAPRPDAGNDVLDTLRRAPRAIEPPRDDDDRPDAPRG
jgi:hypothetical protein